MYYVNCTDGSSPLARGTPIRQPLSPLAVRLIPARAGNTFGPRAFDQVQAAHPRSRGEHASSSLRSCPHLGSSPLARGTPIRQPLSPLAVRLIPARAGNTELVSRSSTASSAHPRSRGEHTLMFLTADRTLGSSPLARGTPEGVVGVIYTSRLIPARAGNTLLQIL